MSQYDDIYAEIDAMDEAEVMQGHGEYEPLPDGWYEVMVNRTEEKTTTKGGVRLNIGLRVMDGKHEGRLVFMGLNIVNDSPIAQNIARSELKRIVLAAGVKSFRGPDDLLDCCVMAKVGREKGDDTRNAVKAFKPVGTGSDAKTVESEPVKADPAKVAAKPSPWKKK